MAGIYSVTQVNSYIRGMFSQDFVLKKISIEGEISNCKYHSSGHIYFTIKDENSALSAVMFAGSRGGLAFRLEEGQNVVVSGSIEVYERAGTYQLYAVKIEKKGLGDLYERFLKLKDRLEETGIFSDEYKRPLPKFALTVGVVTAPTGAAVHDIINITRRRNPHVNLVLYPALVQGDRAPESIIKGIKVLDAHGVDVIIVGRGGGSMEDLWSFNDENVVRAIFEARTPIISAVGHETDVCLSDYAADLRAPTPSAAAELAVFDYESFMQNMDAFRETLRYDIKNRIAALKERMDGKNKRLMLLSPGAKLNTERSRLEELRTSITKSMKSRAENLRHSIMLKAEKLNGLSPLVRLLDGYAYVSDSMGQHIKRAAQAKDGSDIKITFYDGVLSALVKQKDIKKNRNE